MTGFDKISNSIEVLHGLNFSVDPPYYSEPSRLSWWLILLLTLATVRHVTAMVILVMVMVMVISVMVIVMVMVMVTAMVTAMVMVISAMVIVTFTIYHIVTITATSVSYIDILLMFINHLR